NRRVFLRGTLAGAAALGAAVAARPTAPAPPKPAGKARMKAGQQHRSSDADLRVLAALGVQHICSALPSRTFDDSWSVDGLTRLRERVERNGIRLEMVPLPLSNAFISRAENPNFLLGKSPERDREIDRICQMIRTAARAGIPAVKYNLTILGVVRTEPTRGRGGARYSTFVYDKAKQDDPPRESGPVREDQFWERIAYFLQKVVPVAEECKVRLCCHPHDPGMPRDRGFRGVHRVLGSVEGLKRFVETVPSPYHGLNFCQGS